MRNNLTLKLLTLSLCAFVSAVLADANPDRLKRAPEQADWYQQLQNPKPLTQANVFKAIDLDHTQNYSVLTIQTKPLSALNLQGHYQVEILGGMKDSSVTIMGSQEDVLNTQIGTEGNTLTLSEKQAPTKTVTVKISMPAIESLTNNGNGNINAENLNGQAIHLVNNGNGNIFITGNANFKEITLNGHGNIEISQGTADASLISDHGAGNLVMQGNYAIKTLTSTGNGNIRIDGMNSRGVDITAQGNGNILLSGFANLEKLLHSGNGNIFFYWVKSDKAVIQASGQGVIGLAGQAKQVNALIDGQVVFDSRYLRANNLEIKTLGNARAKVIANDQLTAAASDQSQIFYYNQPKSVLKYNAGSAVILSFS